MKWEYKTLKIFDLGSLSPEFEAEHVEGRLNSLGDEGWELVSLNLDISKFNVNLVAIAIFKRQR